MSTIIRPHTPTPTPTTTLTPSTPPTSTAAASVHHDASNSSPKRPTHQLSRSISEASPQTHNHFLHRPHLHHHHHSSRQLQRLHKEDKSKEEKIDGGGGGEGGSGGSGKAPTLPGPHASFVLEKLGLDGAAGTGASGAASKSEFASPNPSVAGSRRPSLSSRHPLDHEPGDMSTMAVKEGQVKAEREKSVLRAAELRTSLVDLNTHSHNTTSRLDNTYYAVLEKFSILQSTISTLRELATATRDLDDSFDADTSALASEVSAQLDNFRSFDDKEALIVALQARVSTGRERVRSLGERVEVVKKKIERWEKVESEWRMRTRKRLKMLWVMMSVAVVLVLVLLVIQYTPVRTAGPGVLRGIDGSELVLGIPGLEERLDNETLRRKNAVLGKLEILRRPPEEVEDDERLRIFDEL